MYIDFTLDDDCQYPRVVYYSTEGDACRMEFNNDGEIQKAVYNSKGIVFIMNLNFVKPRGDLYSNNEEPLTEEERTRYADLRMLKPEDKTYLKLKYSIDISIFDFKNGILTDESRRKIHNRVIELALGHIKLSSKTKAMRWLWNLNPEGHTKLAKESICTT